MVAIPTARELEATTPPLPYTLIPNILRAF